MNPRTLLAVGIGVLLSCAPCKPPAPTQHLSGRIGVCLDNEGELAPQVFSFIKELGLGLFETDSDRYSFVSSLYEKLDVNLYTVVNEGQTQNLEDTIAWLKELRTKMPLVRGIFVYEPSDIGVNLKRARRVKRAARQVFHRSIDYGFLLYPWKIEKFRAALKQVCSSPFVDLVGHDDYSCFDSIKKRTQVLLRFCRAYRKRSFVYLPVGLSLWSARKRPSPFA